MKNIIISKDQLSLFIEICYDLSRTIVPMKWWNDETLGQMFSFDVNCTQNELIAIYQYIRDNS